MGRSLVRASCPDCGAMDLQKFSKRDHIERMFRWPHSVVQGWLGAPLLYCKYCRLQFHDFRPREKERPRAQASTNPLTGGGS